MTECSAHLTMRVYSYRTWSETGCVAAGVAGYWVGTRLLMPRIAIAAATATAAPAAIVTGKEAYDKRKDLDKKALAA